jgi:hypothetical protein
MTIFGVVGVVVMWFLFDVLEKFQPTRLFRYTKGKKHKHVPSEFPLYDGKPLYSLGSYGWANDEEPPPKQLCSCGTNDWEPTCKAHPVSHLITVRDKEAFLRNFEATDLTTSVSPFNVIEATAPKFISGVKTPLTPYCSYECYKEAPGPDSRCPVHSNPKPLSDYVKEWAKVEDNVHGYA